MPFLPEQMTESTLKALIDRLHRFTQQQPQPSWPPKRAWCQEAMAEALGFSSFHAAQQAISKARNITEGVASLTELGKPTRSADGCAIMVGNLRIVLDDQPGACHFVRAGKRDRQVLSQSLYEQVKKRDEPIFWLANRTSMPPNVSHRKMNSVYDLANVGGLLLEKRLPIPIIEFLMWLNDDNEELLKERQASLLTATIPWSLWRHKQEGELLWWDTLFSDFKLDALMKAVDSDLPIQQKNAIKAYLRSLQDFKKDGEYKDQPELTKEVHGYFTMRTSRIARAIKDPLLLEKETIIHADLPAEQMRTLGYAIEEWASKWPKGWILLDGVEPGSKLIPWLKHNKIALKNQRQRIIVSLNDVEAFSEEDKNFLKKIEHR